MSDRAMSAPSSTDAYQPKVAGELLHRMNAIQTTKTFRRIFFLTAAGSSWTPWIFILPVGR
ncbi:hypothetical protein [Secundilactobacillus collinoides]|uniref:hypothetical protein n=1 Tax=Secundilactobacillus collinoides TaxID=33960 RepID=UPI001FB1EBDC|nr:hypothetical protein [Secundilactobacillus collinoides]